MKKHLVLTALGAVACAVAVAQQNPRPDASRLADVYSRPASVVEQDKVPVPQVQLLETGPADIARARSYGLRNTAAAEAASRSLDSMIVAAFPRDTVRTVGDAARHLAAKGGYTLKTGALDADARRALDSKLPQANRTIGPDHVRILLAEIVGPGIDTVVDDAARTVTLVSKPDARMRHAPDPSLINVMPNVGTAPSGSR